MAELDEVVPVTEQECGSELIMVVYSGGERMSWRYIVAVLLGGILGFTGQFVNYCHGRLPLPPVVLMGQSPEVENYLRSRRHIAEPDLPKARELWCEIKFLDFLEYRGGLALASTLMVAFLGATVVFATDKLRTQSKGQRSGREAVDRNF